MQLKTFKNAPKFEALQGLAVAIQTGGTVEISKALYQFAIQCPDLDELNRVAPLIESKMREPRSMMST